MSKWAGSPTGLFADDHDADTEDAHCRRIDSVRTIGILLNMRFEWDAKKNEANIRKHGVSFEEAREVFDDPLHIALLDERFDYFHERWITIGTTRRRRIVVAANLYFDDEDEEIVRIISARAATTKERR